MNPLDGQLFFRGFHRKLGEAFGRDAADRIWEDAGKEYGGILSSKPELKRHNGAMVIPAVALYRALNANGKNAEELLNAYGAEMGKRFARIVHAVTSLPGADRFIWRHVEGIVNYSRMNSRACACPVVTDDRLPPLAKDSLILLPKLRDWRHIVG